MWYAYFKENVPLQVSALSKDALIRYIDEKEKVYDSLRGRSVECSRL